LTTIFPEVFRRKVFDEGSLDATSS